MLLCWCPSVPPAAADFYFLKACMLAAAVTSVSIALHVAFSSELLLAFQVHVADTDVPVKHCLCLQNLLSG